jgi:hypothetical protein
VTVEELVAESTKASGVPEHVEDVGVLAKVARAIRESEEVVPLPVALEEPA